MVLVTVYSIFYSIRCGAEHDIAAFAVIITGMNNGARWYMLYARGDPFRADEDGSVQHPPPKAVLWRSSKSGHIAITDQRVLRPWPERYTLQNALCSRCSTVCGVSSARDRVRLLSQNIKIYQISRRNASVFIFLLTFLDLPKLYLNEPQAWRPLITTYIPVIPI